MTVVSGNVIKSDESNILSDMGVSGEEILHTINDDKKEAIIEEFNSVRGDWNHDRVESIKELPDFVYDEWREWLVNFDTRDVLVMVLENRERDYVHLVDGAGFANTVHTVVELNG